MITSTSSTDNLNRNDSVDRFSAQLFKLLPADAEIIVEVGCGSGLMGARQKRINPRCQYFGVETRTELAKSAHQHLNAVVDSIEQLPIEIGQVNCLVYNNVLSYASGFTEMLAQHQKYLKEDGLILAYVPNLQYWLRLVKLFKGHWNDEPQFLDQSHHLPFFTFNQIKTFFAEANLFIYDIQTEYPILATEQQQKFDLFQSLVSSLVTAIGLRTEEFKTLSRAEFFTIRASKTLLNPKRLLIQTFIAATTGCERLRVKEPDRLTGTIPGTRVLNYSRNVPIDLNAGLAGEEKVFIWQRALLLYPQSLQKQKQFIQKDYLLVAEHDDDPYFWPENIENKFLLFTSCHCIQTSTEPLAKHLSQFHANVKVFPNHLAFLPEERSYGDDETVTLFFGALNREQDWEPIMPALNRVLSKHKQVLVKVVYDKQFFSALQTVNKEFFPLCPYDRFQEIMHGCDIGLLPLLDNQFNRMKSDLKFLEHAGHGVTALASPTVYADTLVEGETGLLYHSAEEFEEKLTELIINTPLRQKLARNAYKWVGENRLLCQHYRQRHEWYLEMRSQLPRLNAELRDRHPELFTD